MSGILRANGVCKYFGGLKAVENVDMEIARIFLELLARTALARPPSLTSAPASTAPPRGRYTWKKRK